MAMFGLHVNFGPFLTHSILVVQLLPRCTKYTPINHVLMGVIIILIIIVFFIMIIATIIGMFISISHFFEPWVYAIWK